MRVISKGPFQELRTRHPESQPALQEWYRRLSECSALSCPERRPTLGAADSMDGSVIFDVGGNKYP